MAIIYSYPRKSNPTANDLLLISDKDDRNITKTVSIASVQNLTSGVFGTGTAGKLAVWTASNMIGNLDYQVAREVKFSKEINSAGYTMLATVDGGSYGSVIKMTIIGVAFDTVVSGSFDIMVNHSKDIHVKSLAGDYVDITLRITSNDNEDYSIEAKISTSAGSPTVTTEVCMFPLSSEIITPTPINPGYTGQVYEHTATEGWRYGGTDGGTESSQVVIDGKLGIGTTAPITKLDVRGALSFPYISTVTGTTVVKFSEAVDDEFLLKANLNGIGSTGNSMSFGSGISGWASDIMTWRGDGSVGIGTTTPDAKLEVIGNYKQKALDSNIGGFTISINSGTDAVDLNNYYNAPLTFSTNNAEKMRITGSGNVGIDNTSPTSKLTVGSIVQETPAQPLTASNGFQSNQVSRLYFPITPDWYRIAKIPGKNVSRGGGILKFSLTGGNTAPTTYVINYWKYYTSFVGSNSHTLKLEQYGPNLAFTKARLSLATDGEVYIEVYKNSPVEFTAPPPVYHDSLLGYDGYQAQIIVSDFTNTLPSGSSGGSMEELPFVIHGTSVKSLLVNGTINLDNSGNLEMKAAANDAGDIIFKKSDNGQLGRVWSRNDGVEAGLYLATSGVSPQLLITEAGNVGIGVSAPAADGLEVANRASVAGGNTQLFITGNTTGRSVLGLGDGANRFVQHILADHTQNAISFHTGATTVTTNERMRIASDGDVGIGEDNPTARLHVSKDNVPDYGYICKLTSTSTVSQAKVLTVQSSFNIGGGVVGDKMFIYSNGDLQNINGVYAQIGSDKRLKENIIDAKPKLNDLLSLKVKNFNFINNPDKHIGFIAQEFEKVFPSLVSSSDTRVYKTHDENGVLLEEQGELISGYEDSRSLRVGMEFAIITKVIQEQQEIIENLKQRIEQLEITK